MSMLLCRPRRWTHPWLFRCRDGTAYASIVTVPQLVPYLAYSATKWQLKTELSSQMQQWARHLLSEGVMRLIQQHGLLGSLQGTWTAADCALRDALCWSRSWRCTTINGVVGCEEAPVWLSPREHGCQQHSRCQRHLAHSIHCYLTVPFAELLDAGLISVSESLRMLQNAD